MSELELKTYPDPCLRIKTKPVENFDPELTLVLGMMADLMYDSQGIGLAAPQVGIGLRMMVVDTGEGLIKFVNPLMLESSGNKSKMEEGCLSLPGVNVEVVRPRTVKVRAQDEKGAFFVKQADGLLAKAIQHEMDHLEGKLIIDYLDPIKHFFATRKLAGPKQTGAKRTCEVVCNVGKRDTGSVNKSS